MLARPAASTRQISAPFTLRAFFLPAFLSSSPSPFSLVVAPLLSLPSPSTAAAYPLPQDPAPPAAADRVDHVVLHGAFQEHLGVLGGDGLVLLAGEVDDLGAAVGRGPRPPGAPPR